MSFVRAIDYIMNGTGLREAIENVYATNTIDHMLSGKAVSRAVRRQYWIDTDLTALLVSRTLNVSLPPIAGQASDSHVTSDRIIIRQN